MSERDPRVDPIPGDVLVYGPQWQRERAQVLSVTESHVCWRAGRNETVTPMRIWREWMKSAEVIEAAKEER